MRRELYDSLFDATREVFKLMLDLEGVSRSGGASGMKEGVAVSVAVLGDIDGEIIYHFSERTALKAVEIMSGMDIESVDEFVSSAICEIANIISGKTMAFLSEQKIVCDIMPPRFLSEEERGNGRYAGNPGQTRVYIDTDIGSIELDILLNALIAG